MGTSTIPADVPIERMRHARSFRRAFLVLLSLFLLAGVLGLLGVRTGTVHAEGGGYELGVRYAKVARSGLAVPWSVTIRHRGGFEGPVTLSTDSSYLDMMDGASIEPEPRSATADGERVVWQLETPEVGDTVEVSLDARIGANRRWGFGGTTAVLDGGRAVVKVEYRTWVMP